MNSLVVKEIRLLLPAYVLALLLAITPLWLLPAPLNGNLQALAVILPIFGALMLALSSFGREFGTGTFPLLLAQPLPRSRIWWTKITVLACALATVCGLYFLSYPLQAIHEPLWYERSPQLAVSLAVAALVILASGLWTTLLLRQMVAAFWIALLVPGAILTILLWRERTALTVDLALGLYSAIGFGWAWRQFNGAQEVAWTGGDVSLPGWWSAGDSARSVSRARRPITALLWKELQLYRVALVGMGGLFVLHLGIAALRKVVPASDEILAGVLTMFGGIWFIVPLLTAGLSVAEERCLGTLEGQLCQPASNRVQFLIKLLFALALSGGLSALLLWTAEEISGAMGAGPGVDAIKLVLGGGGLPVLSIIFMAIALLTFYASTFARHFFQALATAVGVAIVLSLAWEIADAGQNPDFAGFILWQKPILRLISWPAMIAVIIWLASGNFRRSSEVRRLWLHNVVALASAVLLIAVFTCAVYNRAWEFLSPLEPAHGPARINASNPPVFHFDQYGTAVVLPDGRLWQDHIAYDPGKAIISLGKELPAISLGGKWVHLTGHRFCPGSNWVSEACLYDENAAIQSDGTLWVSEKPTRSFVWSADPGEPRTTPQPLAGMTRFGPDADWKKVIEERNESSLLLLKTDGSLWVWGTNHWEMHKHKPGLTGFEPRRVAAQKDWTDVVLSELGIFAWEKNGQAWKVDYRPNASKTTEIKVDPELAIERCEGLDHAKWRSLVAEPLRVGVREDGTLWRFRETRLSDLVRTLDLRKAPERIGTDSDWISAAGDGYRTLVALKRNGTLWKWDLGPQWNPDDWPFPHSPVRLGAHGDWVAIGRCWDGIISLAGDGSLWHWKSPEAYYLLAATRKPGKIENIFDQP